MTIQNENPSFTSPERTNTVRLTIICRPKKRRKPNATTLIYRERVKAVAITLLHSERPYFASQVDHVHKDFARIAGVAENSQSAQLARLLKIKTLAEEAIAEFGSDGPDHNQANEILGKPHYSP